MVGKGSILPNLNADVLLTPEEASQFFKIPESTLQKWRSTGDNNIPFVKIGRCVRYRLADLHAYVDRHVKGGIPNVKHT